MQTENCIITRTMLGIEDHGIMTFFVYVEGQSFGVGLGGYTLDTHVNSNKRKGYGHGYQAIRYILETLEVSKWEDLKGKNCRITHEGAGKQAIAIGHIYKDKWFNLKEYMDQNKD